MSRFILRNSILARTRLLQKQLLALGLTAALFAPPLTNSVHADSHELQMLREQMKLIQDKLEKLEVEMEEQKAAPPPAAPADSSPVKEVKAHPEISSADEPTPTWKLTQSIRKDSPEFLLGRETGPNMKIRSQDNPDLAFHLGVRYMGTAEYSNTRGSDGSFGQGDWDFYGRRVRLEAGASFTKNVKFLMDLRNDRANQGDRGEEDFNVGDAKLTIKKIWGQDWLNSALYRAKVDVSRAQTVKSAFLVNYDRAAITDSASNWVSHNRRASNVQLYGDFDKKIHYSLAVGDGLEGRSFRDAKGQRAAGISGQSSPMLGGKIRLSPFDGWEEVKRTETYFGEGKHFSVGVGQFYLNSIDLEATDGAPTTEIDRELTNIELSAHYGGAFVQAEYFLFDGAVEDMTAATLNEGEADGWYVLTEYVFPEWGYLAPFARFDYWDRFSDLGGYAQETMSGGVNWYLLGNSVKFGLVYQRDNFESNTGFDDRNTFRIISQLFF